jgi:hypothetical protein
MHRSEAKRKLFDKTPSMTNFSLPFASY